MKNTLKLKTKKKISQKKKVRDNIVFAAAKACGVPVVDENHRVVTPPKHVLKKNRPNAGLTGRSYDSVEELLIGEKISPEVVLKYVQIKDKEDEKIRGALVETKQLLTLIKSHLFSVKQSEERATLMMAGIGENLSLPLARTWPKELQDGLEKLSKEMAMSPDKVISLAFSTYLALVLNRTTGQPDKSENPDGVGPTTTAPRTTEVGPDS